MTSSTKQTRKPKVAAVHPKYNDMVTEAIGSLKQRHGSSRSAILKYITANFKVGVERNKVNSHLKICLKNGVANGLLQQPKGTGAAGSFKVTAEVKPHKKRPSSSVDVKTTSVKKVVVKSDSVKKVEPKPVRKPKATNMKKSPAKLTKKCATKKIVAKKSV